MARWVVVVTALALAASCGGPDGEVEAEATLPPSPLAAAMGWHDGDAAARLALDQDARAQEQIESCMAAAGFRYEPWTSPVVRAAAADDGATPGTEAFAERFGYGIATVAEGGPAADGEADTDPNAALLADLDPAGRAAWLEALHGSAGGASAEDDPGCAGRAYAELGGGAEAARTRAEFDRVLDDLDERVRSDPRLVAAREGWAACMAGEGYPFPTPAEAVADLTSRLDGLTLDLTDEQIAALDDRQRQTLLEEGVAVDADELAALQERERAVAVADWRCAAEERRVEADVRAREERTLLADHAALIDRVRALQGS